MVRDNTYSSGGAYSALGSIVSNSTSVAAWSDKFFLTLHQCINADSHQRLSSTDTEDLRRSYDSSRQNNLLLGCKLLLWSVSMDRKLDGLEISSTSDWDYTCNAGVHQDIDIVSSALQI
jgi:hypothetical protein